MSPSKRNVLIIIVIVLILLILLVIPGFRSFLSTAVINNLLEQTTLRTLTLTIPADTQPGSNKFTISWDDPGDSSTGDPASPLAQSEEITVNITTPAPTLPPTSTPTPASTPTPISTPPPTSTPPPSPPPPPPPPPQPQCSDGQDNDEDQFVDAADSGCHTDGNPNNPDSYDPNDDTETSGRLTQCSDSIDNDNDGLVDGGDPQCHTDGVASNPASYDPSIDREAAPLPPTVPTPPPTPTPNPTPVPTPTLASIGGGTTDTNNDVDSEPSRPALKTFTFQAEIGHSFNKFARAMSDGPRRVLALFHERASAQKKVTVPRGDYWLFLTAKHDVPGPVDVGVYINGWPWRAISLDKNDNRYRTHAVGKLRNFSGGAVKFRFLKDKFDGIEPDLDRNLFIDWWQLTESTSPQGVGLGTRAQSPGQAVLPRLNSIVRQVLGPQHVNVDIWYFYAPRLVAPPTAPEAITTEAQLRRVMNYWKFTNPDRPRGI